MLKFPVIFKILDITYVLLERNQLSILIKIKKYIYSKLISWNSMAII